MNLHTWLLHVEYRRILRTVCVILFVCSAPYSIYAQKKLSVSEAIVCGERIVEEWKDSVRAALSDSYRNKMVVVHCLFHFMEVVAWSLRLTTSNGAIRCDSIVRKMLYICVRGHHSILGICTSIQNRTTSIGR